MISPNLEYYCRIEIENIQNHYNHKIENGKLILTISDDEIGPYIKILSINITYQKFYIYKNTLYIVLHTYRKIHIFT